MNNPRLVLGSVVVGGALAAALSAAAATPVIEGTVGPDFTIGLTKKPTKAGKYSFVIRDRSSIHNFHLVGPGVNKKLTSVSGTGISKPIALTLKKGTYRFFCDLHPSLKGSFRIS